MCYNGTMSAIFAATSVVFAAVLHFKGQRTQVCIGILYFGLMELLQTVQYFYIAEPEDGYSMCKNPTNQFLTFLGTVHIIFQPVFCNYVITGAPRQYCYKRRIQSDLIHRLCLCGAICFLIRYWVAVYYPDNPWMAARPSKECPNYEWIREGYDGVLGVDTPNLPGHSCTYRSPTPTGHLAWAVPLYQATYFVPSTFLHSFLMFCPLLVLQDEGNPILGVLFFVAFVATGPVLAAIVTQSLNEQAAIWCFYSMFQCLMAAIHFYIEEMIPPRPTIEHPGGTAEKPMHYTLTEHVKSMNNGKKVN